MAFYADLHIHSKYSRATSRDLDLEHLYVWARRKGIGVVGTGDFTHPAWLAEIKDKLVPAEPGLFRLRDDVERAISRAHAPLPEGMVRFLLEVEISTIYKKGDKVRKVHHLLYAPDLEKAERIVGRLARIGNLNADGRPILGLDSRHLLEITLESGEGCFLIPAHVWTPWFSVFGSKSGFDRLEDCYGDLSPEIFALETGLSSDPPMNWRLSRLDRFTLVSNSDAHSPGKLGREACLFRTAMSYFAIRDALKTGEGYGGTVEFFPEEGKYHMDGCRGCEVQLEPEQTRELAGRCPKCGKPVTVGVMSRVNELADRPAEAKPARPADFGSLVPLNEVLGEIEGTGPQSKAVARSYAQLLSSLGSELFILREATLADLHRRGSSLLAEAVRRMRAGEVIRKAGYDGEYGVIRVFHPEELKDKSRTGVLFDLPEDPPPALPPAAAAPALHACSPPVPQAGLAPFSGGTGVLDQLDPEQREAARHGPGPLLIVAGPGTGKTRTLTHRLAHLVSDHGIGPESCLAVTFTRRAAEEMRGRLGAWLGDRAASMAVLTFHALGRQILEEQAARCGVPLPLRLATEARQLAALPDAASARRALQAISQHKRAGTIPPDGSEEFSLWRAYHESLGREGLLDFDDLVRLPVRLLEDTPDVLAAYRERFRWISVDEYQDIDALQYRLVRLLAPGNANLCVIGDPDQAIYSFRGAEVGFFQRFQQDYPGARVVHLNRNYRSIRTIVDAAAQIISPVSLIRNRAFEAALDDVRKIEIHDAPTDRAEAEWIVRTIEELVGGASHLARDSGRIRAEADRARGFADFAILYRAAEQASPILEALERSGFPFQQRGHDRLADFPFVQSLLEILPSLPAEEPLLSRLEKAAAQAAGGHASDARHRLLLDALRPFADRHGRDLPAFLADLELAADADLWDPRADRISLLTLHASKGLEFPVVFIAGCEDGLLPLHFGAGLAPDALAEERRLFFVGVTRARERLFLSHTRKRLRRGRMIEPSPSPFLASIEEALRELTAGAFKKRTPKSADEQLSFF